MLRSPLSLSGGGFLSLSQQRTRYFFCDGSLLCFTHIINASHNTILICQWSVALTIEPKYYVVVMSLLDQNVILLLRHLDQIVILQQRCPQSIPKRPSDLFPVPLYCRSMAVRIAAAELLAYN